METRRLYRSRTDRQLGGVAAGLARYLNMDVTLVRIAFVLLALFTGFGAMAYLAFWLLVPYEGEEGKSTEENVRSGADEVGERVRSLTARFGGRDADGGWLVGIGLVLFGVYFALRSFRFFDWLNPGVLWPLLMIAAGAVLLSNAGGCWRSTAPGQAPEAERTETPEAEAAAPEAPRHPRRRGTNLTGALLLIAVGGFFLALNFGLLDWSVLDNIWRFWPVLLILAGLEALIGGRSAAGLFAGVIVLGILVAMALAAFWWFQHGWLPW